MPPKKRAATPAAGQSTNKRVRISHDTTVIGQQASDGSHASGRPKRTSTSNTAPVYNSTRPKAEPKLEMNTTSKSTRPVGRPKGNANISSAEPAPSTPKRGRPSANLTSSPATIPATANRGRPKSSGAGLTHGTPNASSAPRKRGRPSLSSVEAIPTDGPGKKVGRPKASPVTKDEGVSVRRLLSSASNLSQIAKTKSAGRPKKTTPASRTATISSMHLPIKETATYETDPDDDETENKYEDEDGRQYWLMKAEPESRIEKGNAQVGEGKNVQYSIDDLKGGLEPEGWDGIRNYAARNNMRAMKAGDLAFFYHSNTKTPGIAGIMEIVREHSVDDTAHDPSSPYYDPKSTPEKPRWDLVHVSFRRKFADLISLKDLQKYGKPGGVLEGMQLLRQGRLSVSKVSVAQWRFIMDLAGDEGGDEVDGGGKGEGREQEFANGEPELSGDGVGKQDELASGEPTSFEDELVGVSGIGPGNVEIAESQEIPSSADGPNDAIGGVIGKESIQDEDEWFKKGD